jgi:hypothetical protein
MGLFRRTICSDSVFGCKERAFRNGLCRRHYEETKRLALDAVASIDVGAIVKELREHEAHAATLPPDEAEAYLDRVDCNARARADIAAGRLDAEEYAATLPPDEGEAFLKAGREREKRLLEESRERIKRIKQTPPDFGSP